MAIKLNSALNVTITNIENFSAFYLYHGILVLTPAGGQEMVTCYLSSTRPAQAIFKLRLRICISKIFISVSVSISQSVIRHFPPTTQTSCFLIGQEFKSDDVTYV